MKATFLCTVVLAISSVLGHGSFAFAQSDYPANIDLIRTEQERAVKDWMEEQEKAVKDWIKAGQKHVESFKSPLISADSVRKLPFKCIEHLKKEKEKLEKGGYSKEMWVHHVIGCKECCAPLFADLMVIHVEKAVQQPHIIILFDFDTHYIKDSYHERLDEMLSNNYDKNHSKVLLIGRASKVGDRAYNLVLSGKRAGEVKDYFVEKLNVDESKIRFLYFGYDPPQLTPTYAKAYGITEEELSHIDSSLLVKNPDTNKINQSVVIILYKEEDDSTGSRPQG